MCLLLGMLSLRKRSNSRKKTFLLMKLPQRMTRLHPKSDRRQMLQQKTPRTRRRQLKTGLTLLRKAVRRPIQMMLCPPGRLMILRLPTRRLPTRRLQQSLSRKRCQRMPWQKARMNNTGSTWCPGTERRSCAPERKSCWMRMYFAIRTALL